MPDAVSIATRFQFCPACGAPRPSPGTNPLRCNRCDFTYFFGPTTAVGGIIQRASGEILLIRREKDPGAGKFGLPGGFVDPGESSDFALQREVDEELGVKLASYKIFTTLPNEYVYKGSVLPVLDIFYACQIAEDADVAANPHEVRSWQWSDCDQEVLEQMAFASNRRAIELYLETIPG